MKILGGKGPSRALKTKQLIENRTPGFTQCAPERYFESQRVSSPLAPTSAVFDP
jgi:hypothetical protein